MNLPLSLLSKNFEFNFANYSFTPAYWEAGLIVILVFFLILSFAQFRRHLLDWSFRGAIFGIFFGFLLALFLEGFLIISGKTAITELLGWKSAPKPVANLLDAGKLKLIDVLGTSSEIRQSFAEEPGSVEGVVKEIQSLNPTDTKKVKSLICTP